MSQQDIQLILDENKKLKMWIGQNCWESKECAQAGHSCDYDLFDADPLAIEELCPCEWYKQNAEKPLPEVNCHACGEVIKEI